jgi:glutathione-specific gamma-glutamylcyclotransferase
MDANDDSAWVFGYGSLIWRPGFDFVEKTPALLRGAHRCLCIYSHRYRGTPEQPGLVFGLAPGGSVHGMAYRIDSIRWPDVREYLRDREQVTGVYREANRPITLTDGRAVTALTFLVDAEHAQYAGQLPIDRQVEVIRQAEGSAGANTEYVVNTARHLVQMGIEDRDLLEIARKLAND